MKFQYRYIFIFIFYSLVARNAISNIVKYVQKIFVKYAIKDTATKWLWNSVMNSIILMTKNLKKRKDKNLSLSMMNGMSSIKIQGKD